MTETAKVVQVAKETIFEELQRDLAEWLTTDRDQVWHPPVTLKAEENEFAVRAFLPGVDAGGIEIWMAPDLMLIKGENRRGDRQLLGSIKFPMPVNPNQVHAEINDGLLAVWATIADGANMHFSLADVA